ncbi:MAG: type II toxin-antitoxin system RelE/ParE family toxin [Candidatus Diapherotrites archaeon]|nr:type II toxin-antitoxin system RelE/ParE family toxin [Candidatus Diapherotrites archaeon]
MSFEAVFLESFADDVARLDGSQKTLVEKRLRRLTANPFSEKPLHGQKRFWASRILNLRIIYRIEGQKIFFARVSSRKDVYKNL